MYLQHLEFDYGRCNGPRKGLRDGVQFFEGASMKGGYGFVYVLCSPLMPGVYKIGSTRRSPHERAREISRGTGVPEEFLVAFYIEIESPESVEFETHLALSASRVSDSREFFKLPLIEIIRNLEGDGVYVSSWDSDMAIEARNPGKVNPNNPLWFEQQLHASAHSDMMRSIFK